MSKEASMLQILRNEYLINASKFDEPQMMRLYGHIEGYTKKLREELRARDDRVE